MIALVSVVLEMVGGVGGEIANKYRQLQLVIHQVPDQRRRVSQAQACHPNRS